MGHFCIGMYQNPSLRLRVPSKIISVFFTAYSFFLVQRTLQLLSHNWPTDIKEELFNSGIMDDVEASIDSYGDKGIITSSVNLMVAPLRIMTPGPSTGFISDKICLS